MIIRLKKVNRPETEDHFVDPAELDYWVDSEKHHLCVEIRGEVHIAKRGKEEVLEKGLAAIHEAVTKNVGFVDLSQL